MSHLIAAIIDEFNWILSRTKSHSTMSLPSRSSVSKEPELSRWVSTFFQQLSGITNLYQKTFSIQIWIFIENAFMSMDLELVFSNVEKLREFSIFVPSRNERLNFGLRLYCEDFITIHELKQTHFKNRITYYVIVVWNHQISWICSTVKTKYNDHPRDPESLL